MSNVTVGQVERVRKYSGFARGLCTALLVLLAASYIFMVVSILDSPGSKAVKFTVGSHFITADRIDNLPLKLWLLVILGVGLAISAGILYLLRRVFVNMARGEIFSAGNVLQIRRIALSIVFIGVVNVLVPLVNAVLMAQGFMAASQVTSDAGIHVPGALAPFATAGLIYLMSWIMEVGLGVSTEAAELRRDAELVV